MKWFKHLSGSLKDSLIFESIEKFGPAGYLVFFGTLELMSDEFDVHNPGKNTISIKKLRQTLQLSRQKTIKVLTFFDQKAKSNLNKDVALFATVEGDMIHLNCPRLKELTDEYTNKILAQLSGQDPDANRDKLRPKEEEEEEEEERDKEEKERDKEKEEKERDKRSRSTNTKINTKTNTKKKGFTPPTLNDVLLYFEEKGYSKESAKKAFDYYSSANWSDSRGNKIKNWKQKMIGVWFKPENEARPEIRDSQPSIEDLYNDDGIPEL